MGLRQPSQIATFYKQAEAGAEQQKQAREKLKQQAQPPQVIQALGGSAAAGTAMVAATTGAQQQATKQLQDKGTELQSAVTSDKIKSPTLTSSAYTGASSNVLGNAVQKSVVDELKDPSVERSTNTIKIGKIKINVPKYTTVNSYESSVKRLTENQNQIQNSLNIINNAIAKHDEGVEILSNQDLKTIETIKNELMKEWQKFDDAIRKENLGDVGQKTAGEVSMEEREIALAQEGDNVGKLESIFGPRFNARKYGALASQIYGKDLEAIQEAAYAGLKERDIAKLKADAAEKEFMSQLTKTKEGVESKFKTEQNKIEALKIGWETLKNRGETLNSLSKIFGSEEEAKKYFNFDSSGNIISDKRSVVRNELLSKKQNLGTELDKSSAKIKEIQGVVKQMDDIVVNFKNNLPNITKQAKFDNAYATSLKKRIDNITNSGWLNRSLNAWSNISDDAWRADQIKALSDELVKMDSNYTNLMNIARSQDNLKRLNELKAEYDRKVEANNKLINDYWSRMTDNAKRFLGK